MALVAPVKDGQIVETESQTSLAKTTSANSSTLDKDAFLQLLVAQMKYQDPLEPTSNTEYISQYAQFSQVEQMQNMSASMDLQRASSLVGKEVYVKTTNSQGVTNYVQGKVDYVVYENGKAYVAINEQLYSLDDLDTIADSEYLAAYNKASEYVARINKLPSVKAIDLTDGEEIDELEEIYNQMTDYEKTFIASDVEAALKDYVAKIDELRTIAAEQEKAENAGNTEGNENPENGEGGDEAGDGE